MKKPIRFLSLVLCMLMVISMVCGCQSNAGSSETTAAATGDPVAEATIDQNTVELINMDSVWPITNETYKLKIAITPQIDGVDASKYYMFDYLKKNSNLDIEWNIVDPSARVEKVALMMATGDMPDAYINIAYGKKDLYTYGAQEGMLRSWNDLLAYMPNFSALLESNPTLKAEVTSPDGNIYGLPALNAGASTTGASVGDKQWNIRFFYNQNWLDNLGLEIPTDLDEFYDVLVAIRDEDADGDGDATNEIPFSGVWDSGYNERNLIAGAMGFASLQNYLGLDYTVADPAVSYFPASEEYYDYLAYMKKLYDEGLMDPDIFTQSDVQYNAKTMEGNVGFGEGAAPSIMNADASVYTGYIPLTSESYTQPLYPQDEMIVYFSMVMSADVSDEKAQVIARLADTFFDTSIAAEYYYYSDYGTEQDIWGCGQIVDEENGWCTYNDILDADNSWVFLCQYVCPMGIPGFMTTSVNMGGFANANPDSAVAQTMFDNGEYIVSDSTWFDFAERCMPYEVRYLPDLVLEEDDLERAQELSTELDDYVKSMEAKFITGVISLDEFDAFQSELVKLGVEELVDIYTPAWENYYANMQ